MGVTGCASFSPAHLDFQTKVNFDSQCENSSPNFSSSKYSSLLPSYQNPKAFFLDARADSEEKKAKVKDVTTMAKGFGLRLGEFEAETYFWTHSLEPAAAQLDVIYNYRSIMYENLVLPKKLSIETGGVQKTDNVLVNKGHVVRVEGNFIPIDRAPSWRDFFPMKPSAPKKPTIDPFELSGEIEGAWERGLLEGYAQGVCFAFLDYKQSMLSLKRDYSDRFLYVVAAERGFTKKPDVSSIRVPVQIGDSEIELGNVNYKVLDNGDFMDEINWGSLNE